jgi:hypothetical protein
MGDEWPDNAIRDGWHGILETLRLRSPDASRWSSRRTA